MTALLEYLNFKQIYFQYREYIIYASSLLQALKADALVCT